MYRAVAGTRISDLGPSANPVENKPLGAVGFSDRLKCILATFARQSVKFLPRGGDFPEKVQELTAGSLRNGRADPLPRVI